MRTWKIGIVTGLALLAGSLEAERKLSSHEYREWRVYGGGSKNIHYSALRQITRENVRRLEAAWAYDTGDAFEGRGCSATLIVVDGVLYATTPKLRVIALDAPTGKLIWSFDPSEGKKLLGRERNRGVTYWQDGEDKISRQVISQRALRCCVGPRFLFNPCPRVEG
ncbi:MAG: hypothetical protein L0387_11505 [Acidobacteria bacterium]|nr:hypothetical protein [Acidobacteriota bacterium]MCI0622272.1 hypothetical protein [Acidobacteriota bacterium]MCI0718978.1 hypothetical protein [Acidobacteriota bacterium]